MVQCHEPGVVAEDVEAGGPGGELLGEGRDGSKAGEIELAYFERCVRHDRPHQTGRRFSLVEVAAGHDDCGTGSGESLGDLETQSRVGAGDDGNPAGLIGDVLGGPMRSHDSPQGLRECEISDDFGQFDWLIALHAMSCFDNVDDLRVGTTTTNLGFIVIGHDRLGSQATHQHEFA